MNPSFSTQLWVNSRLGMATSVGEGKTWNSNLLYRYIGLAVRVFAKAPVDQGSISGRVIPRLKKIVLHAS